MWDLLSAFHAYIRHAEIYREEAGLFSSLKQQNTSLTLEPLSTVKNFIHLYGRLEIYDKLIIIQKLFF